MISNLIADIKNSTPEYRRYYLSILFLGLYTYLSLPLLYHDAQWIPFYALIIPAFLMAYLFVRLLWKRTINIAPLLLFAMIFLLYTSAITRPITPFELFLLLPIYQISNMHFRPVYFWGTVVGYCLLAITIQSGLLISSDLQEYSWIMRYRWIISAITLAPIIILFSRQKKKTIKSANVGKEIFHSIEAYIYAIDAVDIGLWSWDTMNNVFNISRQCGNLLQIQNPNDEPVYAIHGIPMLIRAIHNDDKEKLNQSFKDIINSKIDEFELNVRITNDPETTQWLCVRARRHNGNNGTPVEISGTISDITQNIQFERKSHFFETFDPLTNLPNKKTICEQINALIEEQKQGQSVNFGVMIINIDRFNAINESLGRSVGDDLLKAFAQRLEKCMRMVDGVARLSEDTFIILVSNVNSFQKIYIVADRIQERIQMPFWIQRNEIYITASIGIALYHPTIMVADEIIQEAEIAMFNAKSRGKAMHALYQPEMREMVNKRHQIERGLRKALDHKEFELYYQPIVSLNSGVISGLEALIRWNHPEKGIIPPSEFIPIAEESGLIIPIGDWVLETACWKLSELRFQNPEFSSLTMSINLSAAQLSENLIDKMRQLLTHYEIPGSSLILEITETTVMSKSDTVSKLITELRSLHVRLHIDDFGTGYSSFQYLQNFPVDSIKIDRSFISQLESSHNNYEIVRTVVNLAHELGMTAIAEGVETSKQQELLRKFGCESIQGYLISRPIPGRQLNDYLVNGAAAEIYMPQALIDNSQ